MNISVDCDDVLADTAPLLAALVQAAGISNFHPVWQHWEEEWGRDVSTKLYSLFYDAKFLNSIPPTVGAQQALQVLVNQGITVNIITSRAASTDHITKGWLQQHFGSAISQVFHVHGIQKKDKFLFCQEQNIAFHVEDNPVHIEELRTAGIPTLIFDRPWNKQVPEDHLVKRVYSWQDVVEHALQLHHEHRH